MKNKKVIILGRNIGLFAISSFGSKIVSFLLVPLYTTVLSAEEYGCVDIITTTSMLLIPILTFEIQDAVLRYSVALKNENQVMSIGLQTTFKGIVIISTILILGNLLLQSRYEWSLVFFLILSCFFGAINNVFTMFLKGIGKVSVVVVSGLINTVALCMLNILLLIVIPLGMHGYLISYSASLLLSCGYQFLFGGLLQRIENVHDKDLKNEMLSYSKPLIANQLSWWVNNASDRYILTFLRGVTENGIYSVSYKVPTILSTLQAIFFNAWSISAINDYDAEDRDGFLGHMYEFYSLLSILSCSAILILNKIIATILYKKSFFGAWHFVPILLVGTIFNGLAMFIGAIFTATKQSRIISRTTVIGAMINTIGNIPLIYLFGGYGAAVATCLGYFSMWLLRIQRIKMEIKLNVKWKLHFCSLILVFLQACLAMFDGLEVFQLLLLGLLILSNYRNLKEILIFIKGKDD